MTEKETTLQQHLRRIELKPLRQKEKDSQIYSDDDDSDENLEGTRKVDITAQGIIAQLTLALAVALVSFIIGYTSAYTSPAGKSLEHEFGITEDQLSWISGLMALAASVGGLLGGPLIEILGRKYTLLLTDLLFVVGWLTMYFATNHYFLYASRIIAGCSVGIGSLIFPVYLGETMQPEVRGTLGLLPTAFGNIGMLVCAALGFVMKWKGLAGIGVLLPLPFVVFFVWVIPETPQWYISKGRTEESKKALQWLRGKDQNIDEEFESLVNNQNRNKEKVNFVDLLTAANLKPFLIILGLMFFQQMSGINAVIFYTNSIFEKTGSNLEPNVCTTIVVTVNFISVFIATVLIDKLGRKILIYISSVSIIITMAILGAYFYILRRTNIDVTPYGWVPLASFVIYVLGFSLGYGPVPWLMMGEILPAKIRGVAGAVATAFNWLITFLVTKTFFSLIQLMGEYGVFWMFGVIMVISLGFTIICVPETKGRSLDDIERVFAGESRRTSSSVSDLKPTAPSIQ